MEIVTRGNFSVNFYCDKAPQASRVFAEVWLGGVLRYMRGHHAETLAPLRVCLPAEYYSCAGRGSVSEVHVASPRTLDPTVRTLSDSVRIL
jgi:hypothetical protein